MEPALRIAYVNLISQNASWFHRLNENRKREKKKNYMLSDQRLENPEELQLHHNHEKFLFLTVLLLFAQCKMNYW
jgi:hypothetical protein